MEAHIHCSKIISHKPEGIFLSSSSSMHEVKN